MTTAPDSLHVLMHIRDDDEPGVPQITPPLLWDWGQWDWPTIGHARLMDLYMLFANVVFTQVRIVADTAEHLDAIRGMMGDGYEPREPPAGPTPDSLYQPGDQCFAPWPIAEACVFLRVGTWPADVVRYPS